MKVWTHLVKYILESLLSESGTFHVLDGPELPGQPVAHVEAQWPLLVLGQLLHRGGVISQIYLCPHQEEGSLLAMVGDLWDPLFLDIFKTRRGDDTEAHEEDICLGIGEGSQPVVVLLPGGIEEPEGVRLPSNHDSHSIVVKHLSGNKHEGLLPDIATIRETYRRNVLRGKFVCSV